MGTSVLVVEDESIVALDLSNRLKSLGFEVVGTAGSGKDALSIARKSRPDVVLMDIRIKGSMDGIETARIIKDELDVPSIFLTAYSDRASLDRAKRTDAYGYLLKPFQERELQIAIELALYKHTTEGELRRNRNLLETTLNSVDHGVITADRQGVILFLNAAAEKMTGWSSVDAVGRQLNEVFLVSTVETSEVVHRYELRRSDGDILPVEVTTRTMSSLEENHPAEVVIFRDISDTLRYEKTLVKAKEAAEAATRTKNDFLARVSHELRTPMNSIIGMVQLASERDNPAETKEFLDIVMGSAQTLKNLITDVLDFVAYDQGKTEPQNSIFSTSELVDTVARSHALSALGKQLRMFTVIDPFLPSRLYGDEKRLARIIGNLLSNAVKFTEKGHVVMTVTRTGTVNTGESVLEFIVEDTGAGIARENIPRIFEDFSQLESPATRHAGGPGLGLAIVRQLVEAMNGSISVDSTLGAGTVMKVLIPLGIADPKTLLEEFQERLSSTGNAAPTGVVTTSDPLLFRAVRQWAEATDTRVVLSDKEGDHAFPEDTPDSYTCFLIGTGHYFSDGKETEASTDSTSNDGSSRPPAGTPKKNQNVLIVDDDSVNLLVNKKLVENMGYTVRTANNGESGLEMIRSEPFVLACVDIEMPGMSGWEVARLIRDGKAGRESRNMPIVAITGHDPDEISRKALQAGFTAVLTKPFAVDDLGHLFQRWTHNASVETDPDKTIDELKTVLARGDIQLATKLVGEISEVLQKPDQCEILFRMKLALRKGDSDAAMALIAGLKR
jgi:PAS domain S-box-containing protein